MASVNALDLAQLQASLPAAPGTDGRPDDAGSVVLVLLALFDDEYHFVLQKRGMHIRQPGEICFPGGRYDAACDSSLQDTAIRETVEELGIPAARLTIAGALDTIAGPAGDTVHAFLGVTDILSLDELTVSAFEVEEAFSLPVAYFEQHGPRRYYATLRVHPSYVDPKTHQEVITFPAQELGLPERYWQPWGDIRHPIYVYQVGSRVIWGLTARLMLDVVRRLSVLRRSQGADALPGSSPDSHR
jgi:coenzyme A diphosphatase NUDT7